jgi:hypothetical protein
MSLVLLAVDGRAKAQGAFLHDNYDAMRLGQGRPSRLPRRVVEGEWSELPLTG